MFWENFLAWLFAKEAKSTTGIKPTNRGTCLNCKNGLGPEISFCPLCGQKAHQSKLTAWSLIKDFFGSLFNLDNGLYRSLAGLPIPGLLSKQFISGKRKSYLNPVRLFLITLIVHLSVLTNLVPFDNLNASLVRYHEDIGETKALRKFEELKYDSTHLILGCDVDTIQALVFDNYYQEDSTDFIVYDPEVYMNGGPKSKYRVAFADIFDMPTEEFLTTYKLNTWWEQLAARQIITAVRDPSGAIRFGVGNLVWSVLSTIIIVGLLMKLLYLRRKRFFVEHLVVLFNIHSFSFLLVSLVFLINPMFKVTEDAQSTGYTFNNPAYLVVILFFFLSLKTYYNQGWIKTFIKFGVIGVFYLLTLLTMIVLVTLISLLLFN